MLLNIQYNGVTVKAFELFVVGEGLKKNQVLGKEVAATQLPPKLEVRLIVLDKTS